MALPSDDDFKLELMALSGHLYGCINREGDLGPTREEYDRYRDRRWSQSRSLLNVYGLQVNRLGWERLINAYDFACPTLSEAKTASNRRRIELREPAVYVDDDDYPELPGYWTEYVTERDNGDGTYTRTTTRVFQIR